MEFTVKNQPNLVPFDSMDYGDGFILNDSPMMKIVPVLICDNMHVVSTRAMNAVDLYTGALVELDDEILVQSIVKAHFDVE